MELIKERSYCVSLLRKYYADLNKKDVAGNKKFSKTVKPFFSDKIKFHEKVTLVENDKIITQDIKSAENFFSNVKNLRLPKFREINPLAESITNPTLKSILTYRSHSKCYYNGSPKY